MVKFVFMNITCLVPSYNKMKTFSFLAKNFEFNSFKHNVTLNVFKNKFSLLFLHHGNLKLVLNSPNSQKTKKKLLPRCRIPLNCYCRVVMHNMEI